MSRFETEVLLTGIERGRWGTNREVTIRPGRQARQAIGRLLGTRFAYPKPVVIEYYGLLKKSTGFMSLAAEVISLGWTTAPAKLVTFSSIGVEDVADLAPELLDHFAAYKAAICAVRWA